MAFLIGWSAVFIIIFIITYIYAFFIFEERTFWIFLFAKLMAMIIVAILAGLVCRHFCETDEKGYILKSKNSWFKVNYTRKIQHFAAYLIPLIISTGVVEKGKHAISNASVFVKSQGHFQWTDHVDLGHLLAHVWGDFITLLAFLLLIKPVRECLPIFMLQFNSLDRPEDRPHTLKWIVAGNIAPGLVLNRVFDTVFGMHGEADLVFVIILIVAIGDGLAEPVGVYFGRHKYLCLPWFSNRRYIRSWEGSMCVFLSGMIFPALLYSHYANFSQCLASMLILPFVMSFAEAKAPHSMDTPALMIAGYLSLLGIIVTFS